MATKHDVEALLDRNLTVREIAERIGADTAYVRATLIRNRWQGRAVMVGPGNGHHPKFGRLRAMNAELLAALKYLRENSFAPDKACNCHVNPPCSDCVEYGALREAIELADTAIARAEGR